VDELYFRVFSQLQQQENQFCGMEIVFSSTIPMGSGLSSSAALECGFAYILNELFNLHLTRKKSRLSGKNQSILLQEFSAELWIICSVFRKENKVIMLDCNSLEHQYFDADLKDTAYCFLTAV
jgi:galactokinase